MGMTTASKPDFRSPNERAIELMNLFPLNSYWYKVNTFNKNKNKILSQSDWNTNNDPNVITEHQYFNVYAYTSSREGNVYNKCVEIKYENDSWKIYPNGSLYEFYKKDCIQITKEEFEKIEDNFIGMFSRIQGFGNRLYLIDKLDEKSDWIVVESELDELDKKYPEKIFIRRNTVPYSELKIGDKYIFHITENATRMGEIINIKDENNFDVVDRQVTISRECENIVNESIDKRNLFVLVTELENSRLEKNDSERFWILNDDEWKGINFIFDEIKIEMNQAMKCGNDEECVNFKREKHLEKILV